MRPTVIGLLGALLPLALHTSRNLEYEYATLTAWALCLLCLFSKGKSYLWSAITIVAAALTVHGFALIFVPKTCNISGTLAWFFVQCIPSVFLGLSLKEGFQKHKIKWLLTAAVVLAASCFLFLWISPQKRWVSLWLGYLHGPVYDDFVPLTLGVIIARVSHVFFAMYVHYRKQPLLLMFLILFGISLADPINQHGISALNKALPKTKTSSQIVFHHSEGRDAQINELFLEANFHATDLSETLGITLQKPLDIYVYPDAESKKILFGGSETDITDVVTPSIHILADRSPHPTLRHEMVHAILSQQNKLGFHFNMAITEGIAMALAPSDNILSVDQKSRHLLEEGRLPKAYDIFGPLFYIHASQVSYGISGSFIGWLLKIKPAQNFLEVYAGRDISEAYGEDLSSLYGRWQEYLKSVPYQKEEMNAVANYLLNAPSVFLDVCPHSRIDLARGKESLLYRNSNDVSAYWSWLEKINPHDYELQDHRRTLARLGVSPYDRGFEGEAATTANPINTLYASESEVSPDKLPEVKTIQDFEDALLKADLFQIKRRSQKALEILSSLESLSMNPGRHLKRALELRLWILREAKENEQMASYQFLLGKVGKPEFENKAVIYLTARQKYFRNQTEADLIEDFPTTYKELNREINVMNYRIAIQKKKTDLAVGYLDSLIKKEPNNGLWAIERKRTDFNAQNPLFLDLNR